MCYKKEFAYICAQIEKAMKKYLFETHYNQCTLTDTETGVSLTWESGKFNETNRGEIDTFSQLHQNPDALKLARIMREMADYARANYAELL